MKAIIPLLFALINFQAFAAEESRVSSIGYGSVEEALSSLRNNPDASIRVEQEWTIVQVKEENETSIWSFSPSSHSAYPAAIKRTVFEKDGAI
ncbi:hypothetical protein [Marinimicrobium sp. C2-29]|uniref:hypothetical protein n=1 Tax=Marinimicrobium sp. C2-29 TaxID=3139825 RepID=UPI00313A233A